MDAKTIVSYADPLSVTAGDRLRVMVSCHVGDSFRAELVKLVCGDDRPRGTGFQEEVLDADLNGVYPGREQPIHPGSYVQLHALPTFEALSFECDFLPTTPDLPRQTILSGPGVVLEILDRHLVLTAGETEIRLTEPVAASRWHHVRVVGTPGRTVLTCTTRGLTPAEPASRERSAEAGLALQAPGGDWYLAARDGAAGFNGRIEAPRFAEDGRSVAAWDFGRDMAARTLPDDSGSFEASIHQHPARAVKGARWDGSTQRWTEDPSQYAAIHFHADDITDAGWEPDLEWEVPDNLPSGLYAVRLTTETSEDHAVFYVRPRPGARRAPILFLASTATYLAYANQYLSFSRNRTASDAYFLSRPEVGKSLYEYHGDGTGVIYSSRRRPVLNLKPRTLMWSFNADTNLIAWLQRIGADYDVVTDEDLHREGATLLADYAVVVTGAHPEYYSTAMLDGLTGYLERGGRLMYMGGNGFYWRIAFDPADPAVIEVRRAEGGTRSWIAEPGEYYHAFTGEYGGLWRRLGRPPNHVAGVGFAAQGFDGGTYYRLLEGALDPRVAFLLEGVESVDIIGNYGTQGGGAAGEEIDRHDAALGSPRHVVVIASSENHRPGMLRVIEELHESRLPDPEDPDVRADLVFYETPAGGAVFSTGSISYAGALSHNDYDNDVARITGNVLARFADRTPFEYPEG